jgi:O-methyltransferase involved in polyketide biosynthesis
LQKLSKVRALVYLLHKVAVENTFENVCLAVPTHSCTFVRRVVRKHLRDRERARARKRERERERGENTVAHG